MFIGSHLLRRGARALDWLRGEYVYRLELPVREREKVLLCAWARRVGQQNECVNEWDSKQNECMSELDSKRVPHVSGWVGSVLALLLHGRSWAQEWMSLSGRPRVQGGSLNQKFMGRGPLSKINQEFVGRPWVQEGVSIRGRPSSRIKVSALWLSCLISRLMHGSLPLWKSLIGGYNLLWMDGLQLANLLLWMDMDGVMVGSSGFARRIILFQNARQIIPFQNGDLFWTSCPFPEDPFYSSRGYQAEEADEWKHSKQRRVDQWKHTGGGRSVGSIAE